MIQFMSMMVAMEKKKISHKHERRDPLEKDSYVGMMMERVSDKLDLVLEDVEGIHIKIDRLDGRVDNLEATTSHTDIEVGIIRERLDTLETKFEGMEVKFDVLAEDVRQKSDKKDVINLNHRVTKLESA